MLLKRLAGAAMVVGGALASVPSTTIVRAQSEDGRRQVLGMYKMPQRMRDSRPAIWNDPSVLREGDGLTMWASKGTGPKGVAIYKLRSTDGENWQVENDGKPVLEPGGKKDFDSIGVETPMVIKVGPTYHMYYSAYPHGRIPLVTTGHATSSDGVHWTKLGELTSITGPVGRDKGNPWGRLGRGEPAAAYDNGTFYLYFTDVRCRQDDCKGSPAPIRGISLATSKDGHVFEQRGAAPILLQTASFPASQGWEGYSTPWVVVNDGRFELFCDVFRTFGKESIQTAITHLTSTDGMRFQEVSPAILTPGEDWAAMSVRSPSVLPQNGAWRMWYAGDNWDPQTKKPRGSRVDAGIGVVTLRAR